MNKKKKNNQVPNKKNTMVEFLFVWDSPPYPEQISKLLSKKCEVVHTEEELFGIDFSKVRAIIILAELKLEGKVRTHFYGLELLKKLRIEKRILNPCIICSFLPENYFFNIEHKEKFSILKSSGHYFIQLPFNPSNFDFDNFKPIEPETLDDIIESHCDIEGLLNEKFHHLKNATIVTEKDKKLKPDELINKLKNLVEKTTAEILPWLFNDKKVLDIKEQIFKEIEEKITSQENYYRAIEIISNFEGQLRLLLPVKAQSGVNKLSERPKWKVLFIDDEEHICNRVKEEFEKRNVECITVNTAEQALIELDKDASANWITAIIVDYRLLKQPDGHWQDMQGYTLLKHIHLNKPNFLAYFALTAVHRKALIRIQTSYQMRVIPYSKEDILSSDGAFNMFIERVKEEAEKIYDAICSQPQLISWNNKTGKNIKPLKEYYRAHRAAIDYEEAEKKISEQALEFVENIKISDDKGESEAKGHNYKFQAHLKEEPSNAKALEIFRARLLGRRIAIGLYAELGLSRKGIFYAMRTYPCLDENVLPAKQKVGDKSIDALLNTALALSIEDDFPNNLLPEERSFIEKVLKIDLNTNLTDFYDKIELILQDLWDNLSKANKSFRGIKVRIKNQKTAEEELIKAFKIAEVHKCKQNLIDNLEEILNDCNLILRKALRVSGLEKIFKKLGINPENFDDIKHVLDPLNIGERNYLDDENLEQ